MDTRTDIAALVAKMNVRGMEFVKEFGAITTRVLMGVKAETIVALVTIACQQNQEILRALLHAP
tara:strand:- start:334 stop:525 length:192 start_codon:yes stop_codon:yes gene_type:complete